ncbi:MAG: polyprenyl synthetase [Ignavibacteriales bacterium CG07_land_8_20_14_0_80_59_12]|nr:MAG: polyprenyl synthetase [Ignavibacteriales bacterium CG07_land_8_20_14_0_80_59_12]
MRSKVAVVDTVARYLVKQKGKRIRPILVLLSASVSGGINESTYRAASLVEILHTATLVHDDVVDNADTRRGILSVNAIWKNKVAVLMGDYFLARGLLLSLENDDFKFLKTISNTVRRMSEGELLQIQKTRKLDINEETYLRIIGDKTASLIATCAELGAQSATADESAHSSLRAFGENLGIAFQIRDDVLDFVGKSSLLGKPVGGDLKEKKITLPLIHALRSSTSAEGQRIIGLIKNGAKAKDVSAVVKFVSDHGGIEYSEARAEAYAADAKAALGAFPESPGKGSLINLIDFVVTRTS